MALGYRNPIGYWGIIIPEVIGCFGQLTFIRRDAHHPRIDLFNNQLDLFSVQKIQPDMLGSNDDLIVVNID